MSDHVSRRRLLAGAGTAAAVTLAGCVQSPTDVLESGDAGAVGQSGGQSDDPSPPEEAVSDLDEDSPYIQVYDETIGSVAALQTYGPRGSGQGSAFVYDEDHLVTNHHVVAEADAIDVQWTDESWTGGEVVGSDQHSDLAVVAVDDRPDSAEPLTIAEDDPVVGQQVMALGNPLGFDASISTGVVSGVNRSLPAPTGFAIPNAIQTDAPVSPGNSGGPLLAIDGTVIAVVNSRGDNIAFGISAALVQRVVPALIEDGEFEHSYVGIGTAPVDRRFALANDLEEATGVQVAEVVQGGPADGHLQGPEGTTSVGSRRVRVGSDVIVAIDGTEIPTSEAFSTYLALQTDPGDEVTMTVLREGSREDVTVELGARSEY